MGSVRRANFEAEIWRLLRTSLRDGRGRSVGRAKMVEGARARARTSGDEKYMIVVVCVDVLVSCRRYMALRWSSGRVDEIYYP
jgi:hypothetical protein